MDWIHGIDKNNVPYLELNISDQFIDLIDEVWGEDLDVNIRKYPKNYVVTFVYTPPSPVEYEDDHDYPTPGFSLSIRYLWKRIPHIEFDLDKIIREFNLFFIENEYRL